MVSGWRGDGATSRGQLRGLHRGRHTTRLAVRPTAGAVRCSAKAVQKRLRPPVGRCTSLAPLRCEQRTSGREIAQIRILYALVALADDPTPIRLGEAAR